MTFYARNCTSSGAHGFTLIELLITLSILGVMLSLVGPLTMNQLDSAKRLQDREKLNQALMRVQFSAFHYREALYIHLLDNEMQVFKLSDHQQDTMDTSILSMTFAHLEFPRQSLTISASGMWQQSAITWQEKNRWREKALVNEGEYVSQ